jgi:hypothetical protein
MARARKNHVDNGMNLIQVMPFPALNPWNWWALVSPQNALMAAMQSAQATLSMCRACADVTRTVMRQQQDTALNVWLAASNDEPEAADGEAAATGEAEAAPAAAAFISPMVEATRAYSRIGKAFIVAQRDTMRAFSQAGTKH